MRLFLAIALTARDRATLVQIQQHLARARADVKWVEPANLHLTLRFLGEVQPGRIETIVDVVEPVVTTLASPSLQLGGIGTFPAKGPARVVWCGFHKGADALRGLVEQLSDGLQRLGFESEERRYSPHVTLGRVRSRRNAGALRRAIDTTTVDGFEAFSAPEVLLMESRLASDGARYTVRRRSAFAASG